MMSSYAMHVDECIISHTNENEYNAFVHNKKNEALKDRMILIRVPYNLRVDDEVRIYHKLMGDSGLSDVHIAPHALKVASSFAVLSRLEPSKKSGMSLLKKLKLYNGDSVEGFTSKDVKELQEEAQKEGMIGISPLCIRDLHRGRLALSRSHAFAYRQANCCRHKARHSIEPPGQDEGESGGQRIRDAGCAALLRTRPRPGEGRGRS